MFTLWNWIALVVMLVLFGGIGAGVAFGSTYEAKPTIIAALVGILIAILIFVGIGIYNTHTESGKRAVKTWESEKSGGLNRIVHVYDMEGDEIATYKGKFDVEENADAGIVKVKFDLNGERHIIYGSTGTIVIDEIPEE